MDTLTAQLADEIHLPVTSKEGYLTMYYPWIRVGDVTSSGGTVPVPPSGHVAGVWARTDESRGVHKAPANEIVRGALDLAYKLSDDEHGKLNEAGVNAIRALRGQSIKLWGARTLAPGEMWRYLNVRRLVNLLIGSIAQGTRWVVFEPPGEGLWSSVRRDVRAFLQSFQYQGALVSSGAGEGFFVKCDEENNPPEGRAGGRVVIDIGLAGISPAGFQIVRIIQSDSGSIIEWPETI
jgi:phage tail sheath protein FI